MRRRVRTLCLSAVVALTACTSLKDVASGTTVTCSSATECPGGRVCNRGFCVSPDLIDTTPPDLAGPVQPAAQRVRAGQPVSVRFQATEPLAHDGTSVSLALVPPVFLDCAPASAVDWACTYTATGHENAGLGGDIGLDVRMRDRSGNDTARSSVGIVTFDFAPPSPNLAGVAYYPAATNPLPSVTVAGAGTEVRVAVSASEVLSGTARPALVGRSGAATLRFDLRAQGEADALFATTVAAGQPDGDYALEVGWEDAVGNAGSSAVAGTFVHVKTSRPTLRVDQSAVVFVRSPWGNGAAEDLGGYAVPAGPYFAIEPAEPLSGGAELPAGAFLLDGGVVPERLQVKAGSMTVGTLFPQPGGTWRRQALASPDTYTVQVVGYDAAGNVSDPQPIGTVEWVATSNLPAIGESPHVVRRTPLVEPSRAQRSEVVAVTGAAVGGADQVGVLATAQGVWRKMTFVGQGSRSIDGAGVAYDAAHGRVVMFGGRYSSSYMQETYEWDGREWLDLTPPAGSPGMRYMPAAAYDGARGRVVLFGGELYAAGAYQRFADTWEWDGTAWEQQAPATRPPGRSYAAMAYDSARRRIVLFGGRGADYVLLGDTWEWDGTTWIPRTPAGQAPGAREGHALVYDAARGRTVLVGGATDGAVWEWDGTWWTSVTPAIQPGVNQVVYARDPTSVVERRRVTALGTYADGTGTHAAAWTWDGASWTTITIPGVYPASGSTSVAYDVARERAVLVVGGNAAGWSGTWEWDGAGWRIVTPTGARPSPRYMYTNALAYDSGRRRMVLFGGSAGSDTWEWDGSNWTSVAAAASSPNRYGAGPAYDPVRQRTVFYDTSAFTTWEWSGSAWTSTATATTPGGGTLAWDDSRKQVVAAAHASLHAWTGSDWTPAIGPPVGSTWLGVYETARLGGRLLLVSPSSTAQAMWEWTGSAWFDATPVGTTPLPRGSPGLAYDSERGRAILFGGTCSGNVVACQDTWEFDGSAWRNVTPDGTKPQGRRLTSLCYDSDRHRTVLFSGNDIGGDVYWDDTWELEARPVTRPAIQFDASMARAGVDPASVVRLRVRAWAGGAFAVPDPGATGGAGTTLRGWVTHSTATGPGGWEPIATSQAGPPPWSGPQSATYVSGTVGAADARRFVTERDRQLSFQVVPSGTMGSEPGGARVALDYIEVRVRYAAVP